MNARFRAKALDDIQGIYRRLRAHSAEVAASVEATIFAATNMLGRHPEVGTKTNHTGDVRRWPIKTHPYTIFYRIDWQEGAIDVLRVVDGRRVRNLKRVLGGDFDAF